MATLLTICVVLLSYILFLFCLSNGKFIVYPDFLMMLFFDQFSYYQFQVNCEHNYNFIYVSQNNL